MFYCCERSSLVKVCGITRQEDADRCIALDVGLLGFIFHPKSPRNVTPEQAGAIRTPGVMRVGVFVDQAPEEVRAIMRTSDLHLAQLHGDQNRAFCEAIGKSRVMRVFWPERYATRVDLEADLTAYADCVRFFLFDAGSGGGGHGKNFDFSFLGGLKTHKTWFIAGGLGPHNILAALDSCSACGVDLNSGVESSPGVKDPDLLQTTLALLCQSGV